MLHAISFFLYLRQEKEPTSIVHKAQTLTPRNKKRKSKKKDKNKPLCFSIFAGDSDTHR
jgi:hypothetical protein